MNGIIFGPAICTCGWFEWKMEERKTEKYKMKSNYYSSLEVSQLQINVCPNNIVAHRITKRFPWNFKLHVSAHRRTHTHKYTFLAIIYAYLE